MKNCAKFQIVGRISRIDTYEKVTKITVASNYPYKDTNGEWREDTHWNQVVAFTENTRRVAATLAKGDLAEIEGRVRQTSFDKNGQRVYSVDLNVWKIAIVDHRRRPDEAAPKQEEAA